MHLKGLLRSVYTSCGALKNDVISVLSVLHLSSKPEHNNSSFATIVTSLPVRDYTLEKLSLPILTVQHVLSGENWNLMTEDKIQNAFTNLI